MTDALVEKVRVAPRMGDYLTPDKVRKFHSMYSKAGDDECWIWNGRKHRKGYGTFPISGKQNRYASRVAYYIFNGVEPGKMVVCHRCDNPLCVNPSHLWLGTNAQNVSDRDAKNRTAAPGAKLTEAQIRYAMTYTGNSYDLAREFGVNATTIQRIRNRKLWCKVSLSRAARDEVSRG